VKKSDKTPQECHCGWGRKKGNEAQPVLCPGCGSRMPSSHMEFIQIRPKYSRGASGFYDS
jgi:hypothetical protein